MKKAILVAVMGAVAAGAAAVCAKIIKDRNAQEDYTNCPCGCEGEDEVPQEAQEESEAADAQAELADEEAMVQQEVADSFFEDDGESEVTIELIEEEITEAETADEEEKSVVEAADSEDVCSEQPEQELEEHEEII